MERWGKAGRFGSNTDRNKTVESTRVSEGKHSCEGVLLVKGALSKARARRAFEQGQRLILPSFTLKDSIFACLSMRDGARPALYRVGFLSASKLKRIFVEERNGP
jgi:hypothetical protein